MKYLTKNDVYTISKYLLALLFILLMIDHISKETSTDIKLVLDEVSTSYEIRSPLDYSDEDVYYMAQAIYFEAIIEPKECQLMVAQVIDTRRYSPNFPNTIKEVIWQYKQFSYTHDGKSEKIDNVKAFNGAVELAKTVLGGYYLDPTEGSVFYHNPNIVDWVYKKDYQFVTRCNNHDFYKRKDSTRTWY